MPKKLGELIGAVLLAAWMLFSVGYILNDLWGDFKTAQLDRAYESGLTAAVNSLIKESAKCEPIKVFSEEKSVELISVECPQEKK